VEKLEAAGIGEGVTVVCYDDQHGMVAARLWWMLRYLGHGAVCVLDGGFKAWREAGLPVTARAAARPRRRFVPRVRPEMAVSMADVQRMVQEKRGVLVDARAPERYRGEVEPLDPVAGHYPGGPQPAVDGQPGFKRPLAQPRRAGRAVRRAPGA